MFSRDKKAIFLLLAIIFAIILCGNASASSNLLSGKDLSLISTHTIDTLSVANPVVIDSGVTYTKSYLVKIDKNGHYSTGTADKAIPGTVLSY